MQCRNCGAQNGNVRSCTNCGAPLTADPSVSNYGSYNNGGYSTGGYNNSGSYNNGSYNSGYPNNGGYNSGYPTNGGYSTGGYNTGYPTNGGYDNSYGSYSSYDAPVQPQKKKTALIVSLSAAAVALIVGLIILLVSNNPDNAAKRVAEKFMDAVTKEHSFSKVVDLMHPDIVDQMNEAEGISDREFREQLKEVDARYEEMMGNVRYSYEITDVDKLSTGDLEDIQDFYEDEFGLKVKDAREVEIDITASYEGETDSSSSTIYVVQIGSKWYLDIESMYEF